MWRRRILAGLWWLGVVCIFLTPYAQLWRWSFPAATAALLGFFLWRWRSTALRRVGLDLSRRQIAITLGLAVGLWALFRLALAPIVVLEAGLELAPFPFYLVAVFPFQALNEEMVLGALLLFPLVDRWQRPVFWAVLVAAVFAALHFALYRYGTIGMTLAPLTLVGLLAVGCVRHGAILNARHIGYAWAIHASWNVVMFAGIWESTTENRSLKEPEVFDVFIGDWRIVALSSIAALVLLVLLWMSAARSAHAAPSDPA